MSKALTTVLILTFLVISECSIKLNLQKVSINPSKDGSPAEEDVYVYNGLWGDQKFPIKTAIDISSSSTFIIDEKCDKCIDQYPYKCQGKCKKIELYCKNDDTVINDGQYIQFIKDTKNQVCQVGTDTLRFGNYDISQVSISFPFSIRGYKSLYSTIPASLGVGLKGSTEYRSVQTSFFDSLEASKFRLESNQVSFYFGKQKAIAIFGNPDPAFTQNKDKTVELYCPRENPISPLKTAPNFASIVKSFKVAEKEEIVLKPAIAKDYYDAYFSTTTKFIQFIDEFSLTQLKNQIIEKASLGACLNSISRIDCELRENSVFPEIKFTFQISSDNKNDFAAVTLKGEDYVEKYQTADGKKRVLILFKKKDQLEQVDSVKQDDIIFGEPIFRSNFITFNHDKRRIYIQPAPTIPISDIGLPEKWTTNLLIGSGIAIVVLGTLIILSFLDPIQIEPRVQQVPKTPKSKKEPVFQTIPPNVVQTKLVYTPSQAQILYVPQQQPTTIRISQGSPQNVVLQSINRNVPANR